MKEEDYYLFIADVLVTQLNANLSKPFRITALQGELHQGLKQYCENTPDISSSLADYRQNALKLRLDIFILIENLATNQFEIMIIEVKKVSNLGLTHLSQLIGYCIVANTQYGILINVDKRVSSEFAQILSKTPSLTQIGSLRLCVMTYNHQTRQIEASDYGYFKTISQLAEDLEAKLSP